MYNSNSFRQISAGKNFIAPTDFILEVNTSLGSVEMVLPKIATILDSYTTIFQYMGIRFVDISNNASVNNITLTGFENDKINGVTNIVLNENGVGGFLTLIGNGQWSFQQSVNSGGGASAIVVLGAGNNSTERINSFNSASGNYSIAFGSCNLASCDYSTISGGYCNTASFYHSSVNGGCCNSSVEKFATINNGQINTASGYSSNINNGTANTSSGSCSSIINGVLNTSSGIFSNINNGCCNLASNISSTIINGFGNTASGDGSSIINGELNTSLGDNSFIGNGCCNTASARYSSVNNGFCNTASGCRSFIAGGQLNNTCVFADTFILGSCICADASCTTFVNKLSIKTIPTSSAGLPSGSVWSNSGVLTIVP